MFDSVLIIEDEPELIDFISEALKSRFTTVLCASNGEEALALLKGNMVSLIISDVNLPGGISGIEIIKIARSLGHACPVIFQTGNGEREVALAALRLGAGDLLEKPYSKDDLTSSVERCISIQKRKEQLVLLEKDGADPEQTNKAKKMIGLIQVVNTQKKVS